MRIWHHLANCIWAAGSCAIALASEPKPPQIDKSHPAESDSYWQERTRRSLQVYAEAAQKTYILAVYPDPSAWRTHLRQLLVQSQAKIPLVRDAAGYQAILRYFAVSFQDAHVGITFDSPTRDAQWPGFLLRFVNGAYRITSSHVHGVEDGSKITACDGLPVSDLIATVAKYEIGLPMSLETTRMAAALRLFVDRGSPLRRRPQTCTVAGRKIPLNWQSAPMKTLSPVIAAWYGDRDAKVSTRAIGDGGAWVTLGYFEPTTVGQAFDFRQAIAAAASLRNRRFIILDVRGNGGGPYNWFMAYLRGLYGQAYADHYATARLQIRGVYRILQQGESPGGVAPDEEHATQADILKDPPDPPYEANGPADDKEQARAVNALEPFFKVSPLVIKRSATPANPVRARVYVLTDYGCASACIGFVDELKLFPGVRQIGLPTFVDSRSGTPVTVQLPGLDASGYFASMTRDGRVRADNAAQRPSIRFMGDIRDDAAVERWAVNLATKEP